MAVLFLGAFWLLGSRFAFLGTFWLLGKGPSFLGTLKWFLGIVVTSPGGLDGGPPSQD